MGKIIELSHDDVQNELAYALICETMEGAYWNSGRRRRMFSKAFTRSEQQRINQTPQSADGAYERETIINFCDAEKTCSYYTRNYSRVNELRKLAAEHPDEVKLTIDKEDCVEAEFPKKWVKIRPPMFISEERRAILVESGKKLAALSKEKAARKAVQEKE